MKFDSMDRQTQQMIEFAEQIKRSTGMYPDELRRAFEDFQRQEAAEKMFPWNVMGVSCETFFALQEIAENAEALELMELVDGDDSDALRKHIEDNPVSPECVIKLVRLASSLAESKRKSEVAKKGGDGRSAKLKKLEDETIRLYKLGTWGSAPLAANEITPAIVELSKKGNGDLLPWTKKPLEWIRKHIKAEKSNPS